MDRTGWIERFDRNFFRNRVLFREMLRTAPAKALEQHNRELTANLRAVGKSGDLHLILAVERRFLEEELAEYANSPTMISSLKSALVEQDAAEKTVRLVADPKLYRAVDESHGHPKSRSGVLPLDAARKFFNSHAARLQNLDKSRMSVEEKHVIDARKQNMRIAGRLYQDLQRQALGLDKARARDQGMEL